MYPTRVPNRWLIRAIRAAHSGAAELVPQMILVPAPVTCTR